MLVLPLLGLPANATVILFILAEVYCRVLYDDNLVGHTSAEHHLGIFNADDKGAGMGVVYNDYLDVRQQSHRSESAIQAVAGVYTDQLNLLSGCDC